MTASAVIFYLLALLTLGSALLAVTSRHIFRSAIYLLFSLIGMAGFYFWLQFEFIAAVQIVVYAGGIAVLIIFSVFLTQKSGELLPPQKGSRKFFSALAAFCGFALCMLQIVKHSFPLDDHDFGGPRVADIGQQMLSIDDKGYALPFEVVSILLLAAMIGCIVIAMKSGSRQEAIGSENASK
ncbi:NADH-quinone oxidoreductase subunit J [Pollutibacter soli]|uniref:NADH-quinone oxidoreductase subunit J family protein n=1 Tax=Pollutibacter soli TaxID=3034157 RepID=UPI0030140ECB